MRCLLVHPPTSVRGAPPSPHPSSSEEEEEEDKEETDQVIHSLQGGGKGEGWSPPCKLCNRPMDLSRWGLAVFTRVTTQEQPHRYATEQDLNGSFKVATLPMSDHSNSKLHQSDKYAWHYYFEIELVCTCILHNCKSPESEKPRQRVSNANQKGIANPKSFCNKFITGWRISGYFAIQNISR